MVNYVIFGEDEFSEKLAKELQADFVQIESTRFPDRELKTRIDTSALKKVGDKTALIVIRAMRYNPNPNDCLIKTIITTDTLTKYKIRHMDLLLPYMFYARQDGERLPGESDSLTQIAKIYEELGIRNLITANSHLYGKKNPLQNFFTTVKIYDISTAKLFANYLGTKQLKNPFIISPGSGPEKMAMELSAYLNCEFECLPKTRNPETGRVDMGSPTSDLKGKDIILYDDIASSGGTTEMAYRLTEIHEPNNIFIALAHLWTTQGINRLSILSSLELMTTNSFITERVENPFTELSLTELFSEQLKKIE
ncbi:MAG: ribose-phosphate diphosphokinase [Candidatus Bathyarchaeota archaeon]|nr:MAG: ribose-phosphate diphosphokinase [Candidatus Bathyarchaeota archaeon]